MGVERILVCGYYGHGNAGDDAILTVLRRQLADVFPDSRVAVCSSNPAGIEDLGLEAVDLTDLPSLIEAARRTDLMVLGGGGLFQDYDGAVADDLFLPTQTSIAHYASFAILGGLLGTPVAIASVGVGPLTTEDGRLLTRLACSASAVVTVRDAESAALLVKAGVPSSRITVTADPAFGLEVARWADVELPVAHEPLVAVAVRPWGDDGWVRPLAESLDRLIETHDARVVFAPLQASTDPAAAGQVRAAMRHPDMAFDLGADLSPVGLLGVLSRCDLVIGMRMHAVAFAARTGIPVVALSYDPKVTRLMAELGMEDLAIDIASLSSDGLSALIDRGLAEGDRISTALADRAAELERRADILRAVLPAVMAPHVFAERKDVLERLLRTRLNLFHRAGAELWNAQETAAARDRVQAAYNELALEHEKLLTGRALAPARLWWRLKSLGRD